MRVHTRTLTDPLSTAVWSTCVRVRRVCEAACAWAFGRAVGARIRECVALLNSLLTRTRYVQLWYHLGSAVETTCCAACKITRKQRHHVATTHVWECTTERVLVLWAVKKAARGVRGRLEIRVCHANNFFKNEVVSHARTHTNQPPTHTLLWPQAGARVLTCPFGPEAAPEGAGSLSIAQRARWWVGVNGVGRFVMCRPILGELARIEFTFSIRTRTVLCCLFSPNCVGLACRPINRLRASLAGLG